MKKSHLFGIIAIYSFFAIYSIHKFLLEPGTIGHNWDWAIPALPESYKYVFLNQLFLWRNYFSGGINYIPIISPLWSVIISIIGIIFKGKFVGQFLVCFSLIISCLTMYFLVRKLIIGSGSEKLEKNGHLVKIVIPSFLAGFFYGFSPYHYNNIIGGAITSFGTYMLLPLVILSIINTTQHNNSSYKKTIYLIISVLTLSFIAMSFHNLFLIVMILFLYVFVQQKKKFYFISLFRVFVLFVLLNAHWIVPILFNPSIIGEIASRTPNLNIIKIGVPSILDIFKGVGYFNTFFQNSLNPNIKIYWHFVSTILVISIFYSVFIGIRLKNKEITFWFILLLFSFITSTGGKSFAGSLILWIYQNVPYMLFFRSPQHFITVTTLCYGIVIGLSTHYLFSKLKDLNISGKLINLCIIFVFFAFLFWLHPSFISGNLGMDILYKNLVKNQPKGSRSGHIDNYRLGEGFKNAMLRIYKETDKQFRLLFLPMESSPYYLETKYQREGQGGDPMVLFNPHPVLVKDNTLILDELDRKIYYRQDPQLVAEYFNFLNIKYILLRKDLEPNNPQLKQLWDPQKIKKFLNEIPSLNLIKESYDVDVFVNKYFLPRIYGKESFTLVDGINNELLNFADSYVLKNKPVLIMSNQFNSAEKSLLINKMDVDLLFLGLQ